MKKISKYIFIGLFALSLLGCSTLVQKSGEFLEGNAFTEKKENVFKSEKNKKKAVVIKELLIKGEEKDGTASSEVSTSSGETTNRLIEISSGQWPGFSFRGSLPDSDGKLSLTEARFLSSHYFGWNEFTLDILGDAYFYADNETRLFRINGEVERVQLSSGKIRLKSNYLTGDPALTALKNRRERILAVTEWMENQLLTNNSIVYNNVVLSNEKHFSDFWKPLLFPELAKKSKQPKEYTKENVEWVKADGIKWNKTYTELFFPENLWELRNSGALLRDWEEALPWIFMEYSWETIISSFNETIMLK